MQGRERAFRKRQAVLDSRQTSGKSRRARTVLSEKRRRCHADPWGGVDSWPYAPELAVDYLLYLTWLSSFRSLLARALPSVFQLACLVLQQGWSTVHQVFTATALVAS